MRGIETRILSVRTVNPNLDVSLTIMNQLLEGPVDNV